VTPLPENNRGSLGQTLRNRRLQKGVSFEDATRSIRISIRFLKALETETWAEFPAPIYLYGFLKQYADYLGLDGDDLVLHLKNERNDGVSPTFTQPTLPSSSKPGVGGFPVWGAGILLSVFFVIGLFFFVRGKTTPPPLQVPLNQVVDPTLPAPDEKSSVSVSSGSVVPSLGHTVQLTAKTSVWVRVRVENVVRFEGLLKTGDSRTFSFQTNLQIRVGDLSRVAVFVDGQEAVASTSSLPGDFKWPFPLVSASPESL